MKSSHKTVALWLVLILLFTSLFKVFDQGTHARREIRFSEFVQLLKDGKVFSDSNSNGDNLEVFREFAGNSAALLVKVNDKLYLQAYYLKDLDLLATNIYRRASDADGFEHIGSAQLKRAQ